MRPSRTADATPHLRYALVTPARNEARFIELTIRSVVRQTLRPVRWVIVSDGSTDGTDDIVKTYEIQHPWIELIRVPERAQRHFAGKVHAFNAGYARVKDLQVDVIGNLDGDISLVDDDYFSFLLEKLAGDPRLGLVGTVYKDRSAKGYLLNTEYVAGACQLFRRKCFEDIGGYVPITQGGVDDVAVITARMMGWETRTFPDRVCLHHREHRVLRHGALVARFRDGALDYALGTHPLWELCRTAHGMTQRPFAIGALMLLTGYLCAAIRRAERPVSVELVKFHRQEQMRRLMTALNRTLRLPVPADPRR